MKTILFWNNSTVAEEMACVCRAPPTSQPLESGTARRGHPSSCSTLSRAQRCPSSQCPLDGCCHYQECSATSSETIRWPKLVVGMMSDRGQVLFSNLVRLNVLPDQKCKGLTLVFFKNFLAQINQNSFFFNVLLCLNFQPHFYVSKFYFIMPTYNSCSVDACWWVPSQRKWLFIQTDRDETFRRHKICCIVSIWYG